MSNVKENFLRYVQIETTSSETSGTCPSTPNQWVLAKMLVDELHAMGIENARVDDHCYVYATIPAKGNHPAKVGLISHMDTSDGVKGPTHPVIIEHYDGSAITLKNGVVIDGFPFLKDLQGQELIVTSGDSVLGADDKAGVAEIMALCKRLTAPDAPEHCTVCIGFTPVGNRQRRGSLRCSRLRRGLRLHGGWRRAGRIGVRELQRRVVRHQGTRREHPPRQREEPDAQRPADGH